MPKFTRFLGIDYSGAQTPTASLKGLRVFMAEGDSPPVEVPPPLSPKKYWTRRGIAEWLVERLAEDVSTLVGIDHGFFPCAISKCMGSCLTGLASSTISSAIGRRTIAKPGCGRSCTVIRAKVSIDVVRRAGSVSRRVRQRRQNPSLISM